MKIRSLITTFREPIVRIGESEYELKRNRLGHLIVDVLNERDAALLLARSDVFHLYDETAEQLKADEAAAAAAAAAAAGEGEGEASEGEATEQEEEDEAARNAELDRLKAQEAALEQKAREAAERDQAKKAANTGKKAPPSPVKVPEKTGVTGVKFLPDGG